MTCRRTAPPCGCDRLSARVWPRVGLLGAGSGKHSALTLDRPCWASVGQVWVGADFEEFRVGLGKVESQAGEREMGCCCTHPSVHSGRQCRPHGRFRDFDLALFRVGYCWMRQRHRVGCDADKARNYAIFR